MTSKHTPGPWILKFGKGILHDYIIRGPNGWPVACFEHYKQATKKETKANARLIAAAPELLEALERLMVECDLVSDNALEAYTKARAAIAKATGETQ